MSELGKFIRKRQELRKEKSDKSSKNYVNNEPTDEEKKNNKHKKISLALSILSIILYIGALMIVVSAFESNIMLGFLSILLIPLVTIVQKNAVHHAKKQRNINGRGWFALVFAEYFVPLVAVCGILFLIFGIKFFI